jgi:hypothetical protein
MADPEIEDISVDSDGTVSANVRIERTCAECGDTLKEATLELSWSPEPEDAKKLEEHIRLHEEKEAEAGTDAEPFEYEFEVEETGVDAIEEGGGRYKKSYFGAHVSFDLKCSCDPSFMISGEMDDKVAASEMEELS